MEGQIKWFNPRKGYGFIATAEGNEVFVHESAFTKASERPKDGKPVAFRIKEGDKGPEADEVTVIGRASQAHHSE